MVDTLTHENQVLIIYQQNRPCAWTREPRHFSYPSYSDILPLGVSAFSFFNDYHLRNVSDTKLYIKEVSDGRLPLLETYTKLSKEFQMRRHFSTGVQFMNQNGCNDAEFLSRFDLSFFEVLKNEIEVLHKENLIETKGQNIRLSDKGSVCCDEIVKFIMNQ